MESKKPAKKVRSPGQIAGTAFLIAVLGAMGIVSVLTVLVLFGGGSEAMAKTYDVVTTGACPVAIVIAIAAYFWAKNRQNS